MKTNLFRTVMLGISAALGIMTTAANAAAALDGEVKPASGDRGTNLNYAASDPFCFQTQDILAGEGLRVRLPARVDQSFSVPLPYAKSSCIGIDWLVGSFSNTDSTGTLIFDGFAQQRKAMRLALESAVAEPTQANMQRFQIIQKAVYGLSLAFADATLAARLINESTLDTTVLERSDPVSGTNN